MIDLLQLLSLEEKKFTQQILFNLLYEKNLLIILIITENELWKHLTFPVIYKMVSPKSAVHI